MIIAEDIAYAKKQKIIRKSRKMKQSVLAELMGWKGQQECSDFENGKRHYTESTLHRLCEVLSVSIGEFRTKLTKSGVENTSHERLSKNNKSDLSSGKDVELTLMNLKKIVLEKDLIILDMKLELNRLKRIIASKGKGEDGNMPLYIIA